MAQFRALMLWTDAWIADTRHLSRLERGTYHDLLVLMWRTPGCSVPNDDEWLAKRLCMTLDEVVNELRPLIEEFCATDGNRIWQKRLLKEFSWSKKISRSQSVKAKRRWAKEKDACNGNATRGNASVTVSVAKKDTGSLKREPAVKQPTFGFAEPEPPQPVAKPNGNGAAQRPVSPEADVYRRGTEVLGAKSGGMVTALLKKKNKDVLVVLGILESAADTNDPREYVGRIINGKRDEDLKSIVGF